MGCFVWVKILNWRSGLRRGCFGLVLFGALYVGEIVRRLLGLDVLVIYPRGDRIPTAKRGSYCDGRGFGYSAGGR